MTKEFFGVGSADRLPDILANIMPERILLVTGKQSYALSGAKDKVEPLLEGREITHFSDFETNQNFKDVLKGIGLFRSKSIDLVIAVGGGSVIDMAKLINLLACQDAETPEDYINLVKDCQNIKQKGRPLIAIPTTAGSGSEATFFAVTYLEKTKYSVCHDYILPDYAIIDPQFTFNLPHRITAMSCMDAFSQAIESYWSIYSTEQSKSYSKKAIRLIFKNLPLINDKPRVAREAFSKAAYMAGKAINITKTTAPHAVSYPLTSYFSVSHGQAVALTLPEFLIFNSKVSGKDIADPRGETYVKKTLQELYAMLGCTSAEETRLKLIEILKDLGLATTLREVGITMPEEIQLIVNNVNTERLVNNPRTLRKDDLKEILLNILPEAG